MVRAGRTKFVRSVAAVCMSDAFPLAKSGPAAPRVPSRSPVVLSRHLWVVDGSERQGWFPPIGDITVASLPGLLGGIRVITFCRAAPDSLPKYAHRDASATGRIGRNAVAVTARV